MAEIQPLQALHYDRDVTGGLQDVVAPPYDVIDAEHRARLLARSPHNVVEIDLPEGGEDRYDHAAEILAGWQADKVVVTDEQPALWTLEQDYTGPDGRRAPAAASSRACASRLRPRAHSPARAHAPRAQRGSFASHPSHEGQPLPIFSLYSDPASTAVDALFAASGDADWATTTDDDGTVNHLRRVTDPDAIATVQSTLADTELLIADGHHRYETARVYADEIGGEGPHRYVLMCLVALEDPGLTVFPTHRLVRGLDDHQRAAVLETINRDFTIEPLSSAEELAPPESSEVAIGYLASHGPGLMLTLKHQAIADAALADHAPPYRHLDTAVLEALFIKGALGLSDDDIDHLNGLGYARDFEQAVELVRDGTYDAAFFMAPTPVARVHEVAAAGESMPPKSTYFFPKVPDGPAVQPAGVSGLTRADVAHRLSGRLLRPRVAMGLSVPGATDAAVLVALYPTAASCTSCSPSGARTCAATPARSRFRAAAPRTTTPTCSPPRCARPTRRSACRPAPCRCSAPCSRRRRSPPATPSIRSSA